MADNIQVEDGPILRLVRDAGAIVLVRSNVPQGGLSMHTENYIWGVARNPYDEERSCGGSSGGDGGLVAARCVPIGFGTDIGGSIRIPAHFCGIRGFRPSPWRMPQGHIGVLLNNFSYLGQIKSCVGPLGQTVQDLKLGFKALTQPHAYRYDSNCPPCPFREDVYEKALARKVRIGYFESYDTMPATAPMRRALEIGRAALEKQGYELVKIEFSLEDIREAGHIYTGLVMSHIISPILNRISENYDDILPCYKYSVILLRSGYIVRNLFILLLRITGNARIANAVKKCKKLDFQETSGFLKRQKDLQIKMVRLWKAWGIEAILQPSYASVAFKHANSADMGVFLDYLNFWSLLHYPAGVVPVGTVAPGEDTGYVDTYNDKWSRIIRRDIEGSVGMPISVTIIAQPYEDEVAIGVMQRLDEEVAFRMSPRQ